MEELKEKIEDVEYAIDQIDTAIRNLKKYKRFTDICGNLECEKSALELDLEEFNVKYEELVEEEINRARNESREIEREYWKEVI